VRCRRRRCLGPPHGHELEDEGEGSTCNRVDGSGAWLLQRRPAHAAWLTRQLVAMRRRGELFCAAAAAEQHRQNGDGAAAATLCTGGQQHLCGVCARSGAFEAQPLLWGGQCAHQLCEPCYWAGLRAHQRQLERHGVWGPTPLELGCPLCGGGGGGAEQEQGQAEEQAATASAAGGGGGGGGGGAANPTGGHTGGLLQPLSDVMRALLAAERRRPPSPQAEHDSPPPPPAACATATSTSTSEKGGAGAGAGAGAGMAVGLEALVLGPSCDGAAAAIRRRASLASWQRLPPRCDTGSEVDAQAPAPAPGDGAADGATPLAQPPPPPPPPPRRKKKKRAKFCALGRAGAAGLRVGWGAPGWTRAQRSEHWLEAAAAGDELRLLALFGAGVDVEATNECGESAVHTCGWLGHAHCLRVLAWAGAQLGRPTISPAMSGSAVPAATAAGAPPPAVAVVGQQPPQHCQHGWTARSAAQARGHTAVLARLAELLPAAAAGAALPAQPAACSPAGIDYHGASPAGPGAGPGAGPVPPPPAMRLQVLIGGRSAHPGAGACFVDGGVPEPFLQRLHSLYAALPPAAVDRGDSTSRERGRSFAQTCARRTCVETPDGCNGCNG
jgi:hypothetical protein